MKVLFPTVQLNRSIVWNGLIEQYFIFYRDGDTTKNLLIQYSDSNYKFITSFPTYLTRYEFYIVVSDFHVGISTKPPSDKPLGFWFSGY